MIRQLKTRAHKSGVAVRIAKDLVVVTGERKCQYLDRGEQTRTYFDGNAAYYFRRNAVTGKWCTEDTYNSQLEIRNNTSRLLDKDIFENTCMEDLAKHSVDKYIPTGSKINLGFLLAQMGFLSAEQAAKMDSPVFILHMVGETGI